MYVQFMIAFFVTTLLSTYGNPIPGSSLYKAIKISAGDKCPYLLTTKLLEPEPEFFSKCSSFSLQTLTKENLGENIDDALCLLYYNNFGRLCYDESQTSLDLVKGLMPTSDIDQILAGTYQYDVDQVCADLKKNRNPYMVESTKSGIEVVNKYIEHSRKCFLMCADLEENIKPICVMIAYMGNITSILHNRTQTTVIGDAQNEKGATSKFNKPHYTEHNGDILDGSKIDKKDNQQSVLKSNSSLDRNVLSQGADAGEPLPLDTNLVVPESVTTKNHDNIVEVLRKSLPHPTANQQVNAEGVSGTTKLTNQTKQVHADSTGVPVVNHDGANTAPVVKQEPSKTTASAQPKTVELVNAGGEIGNAMLKPEEVSSVNNDNKINENKKPKYETVKPAPVAPDSEQGVKPTQNEIGKIDGTKIQEDGKSEQQMPAPVDTDQQKPVPDGDNIGDLEQGDNFPSDVDGGDEAAGESPQDLKEPYDDELEMKPKLENEDDLNNFQPKSSEVKAKPIEASKPLQTDEGASSFSVNYQSQNIDDSDSYFFSYFMMVCIMFICGYVAYHNKQKILALVVEGRKGRRPSRTRRPNSANYRKLDSNLEEAVTSSCNKNATQVIY